MLLGLLLQRLPEEPGEGMQVCDQAVWPSGGVRLPTEEGTSLQLCLKVQLRGKVSVAPVQNASQPEVHADSREAVHQRAQGGRQGGVRGQGGEQLQGEAFQGVPHRVQD